MKPNGTIGLELTDFLAGERIKQAPIEPERKRRIELDSNLITNDLGSDGLRSHIGRQVKRGSGPAVLPVGKSTRRNDRDGQRKTNSTFVRSVASGAR